MFRSAMRTLAKASRKKEFTWRYGANFKATVGHRLHPRKLSDQAKGIVDQLNQKGFAKATVDELFDDTSLYNELVREVDRLEVDKAALLAEDRKNAGAPALPNQPKPFVRYLLDEPPVLDLDSVFVKFALQPTILRITNAYFGMITRLAYFNIWHTFVTDAAPQSSQLWHRDFDDPFYIMKVFLFLSDVDEGSGPLSYAVGSHRRGSIKREPDCVEQRTNSRRTSDEQMAEVIPRKDWVQALGPKGTIVFVDTHGYHKGGWAQSNERIVYTCMFTSPTVQLRLGCEQFARSKTFRLPKDPEAASVLMPRT